MGEVGLSDDEVDTKVSINVKDFAYDVSDPKHFGIFDSDDEDDGHDFSDEHDEDDDYYDENDDEDYYEYGDSPKFTQHTEHTENPSNSSSNNLDYSIGRHNNTTSGTASSDLLHAVALYPFEPENSNELSLTTGQILIINYECGDGWLVAYDPETGETGLVPSEYIRILHDDELVHEQDDLHDAQRDEEEYDPAVEEFEEDAKNAQRFMPQLLGDDPQVEVQVQGHSV